MKIVFDEYHNFWTRISNKNDGGEKYSDIVLSDFERFTNRLVVVIFAGSPNNQ